MTEDQTNNSKLMWVIVGALVVIVALGAAYMWLNTKNTQDQDKELEQLVNTTPKPKPKVKAPPVAESVQAASEAVDEHALVNEDILREQVPQNASLAKEELARLEDIQKQLNDQDESLKGQHQDADKLIQLKEEQIKLLEQQMSAKNS
ncbi:hypothetical protein [Acinetobacter shaoyimingii]|uniref:Uncharacterized protein n=1 Tax=Acinetobacter shaoyimingii TaxID=2715164 RepID=A0A6G8RYE8_9GAMM|nr:hypothetical protein [Acinetobacter shaoyimingii]QIO06959.1 hypothetical protein G8E00_13945 [Acinetobacter shaoyimingii]